MTTKFTGKSDARGRNGWFVPRTATTFDAAATGNYPRSLYLEVWSSSTIAKQAPILLRLTPRDAESLIALLQNSLTDFRKEDDRSHGRDCASRHCGECTCGVWERNEADGI